MGSRATTFGPVEPKSGGGPQTQNPEATKTKTRFESDRLGEQGKRSGRVAGFRDGEVRCQPCASDAHMS